MPLHHINRSIFIARLKRDSTVQVEVKIQGRNCLHTSELSDSAAGNLSSCVFAFSAQRLLFAFLTRERKKIQCRGQLPSAPLKIHWLPGVNQEAVCEIDFAFNFLQKHSLAQNQFSLFTLLVC